MTTNLLYGLAVILIIFWVIGFVGYDKGGVIHILLIGAIIIVVLKATQGRGRFKF